jgi:23S rRNA (uracil1939-C5)-methyltransferase
MSTLTIDRVVAGGDGIGRLEDGMTVFVPRTVPGDRVRIEVIVRKRRFARGKLLEIEETGRGRSEPRCVHYARDMCGGCQFQHMDAATQQAVKCGIVGDSLRRIGKLEVQDPEIVPSPQQWRYRSKITLTAKQTPSGPQVGRHRHKEPEAVFELQDCLIVREGLMRIWQVIKHHMELLPRSLESLILREDRDGAFHIFASCRENRWDAQPLAKAIDEENLSIWCRAKGGPPRVVAGIQAGFPPLAFEQSNPELAQQIREEAVTALALEEGQPVWDLYGGVGDTARLLAAQGAEVWSVDADRGTKEWAEERNRRDPPPKGTITHLAARAEEAVHRLPEPAAVVVNPPRRGLAQSLTSWLDRWARRHESAGLAYISCDPATLARDLGRMTSLELSKLKAFDLFPQTSHVETLAVLKPG